MARRKWKFYKSGWRSPLWAKDPVCGTLRFRRWCIPTENLKNKTKENRRASFCFLRLYMHSSSVLRCCFSTNIHFDPSRSSRVRGRNLFAGQRGQLRLGGFVYKRILLRRSLAAFPTTHTRGVGRVPAYGHTQALSESRSGERVNNRIHTRVCVWKTIRRKQQNGLLESIGTIKSSRHLCCNINITIAYNNWILLTADNHISIAIFPTNSSRLVSREQICIVQGWGKKNLFNSNMHDLWFT